MIKANNIDEYIAGFQADTQENLQQVRAVIKQLVPEAVESISYGMPAFTLNNRYLVYFAGYKKHISIYPVPPGNIVFEKDFAAYKTSGKGTIQFALEKPIPVELLKKVVVYRVQENRKKNKTAGPYRRNGPAVV
jgi:uncharacterized protein YdhG (YjbR/CyaY superfamily)